MTRLGSALLLAAFVATFGGSALALPKSPIAKYNQLTKKQQNGLDACYAWCNSHNKTLNSQAACGSRCWDYWSHHQG